MAAALIAVTASLARAQSLGDVARAEEERRAHVRHGRVYKNSDLRPEPKSAPPATAGAAPSGKPDQAGRANESPESAPDGGSDAPTGRDKRDGAYWRTQGRELRALLSDTQSRVGALDGRLKELDAALQNAYSAQLAREREITATALEKAERDQRAVAAALQALEKSAEAAKAGDDLAQISSTTQSVRQRWQLTEKPDVQRRTR